MLSSQIEETQSSLQDLLAAEADLFAEDARAPDVHEVINYVAAMNYGLERLAELPVSARLIRETRWQRSPGPGLAVRPPHRLGEGQSSRDRHHLRCGP